MKKIFLLILTIFFNPTTALSQSINLGSWNIVNLKYNINKKWSLFGEAQLRSLKFYNDFHYYEYKGGFNYKLHKNVTATLGMGSYQTYREGGDFVLPKNNNEIRIWPQIIHAESLGKLKVEQRYRTEMRFTSNGYRNRFRYRLGLSFPFGAEKSNFKPYIITLNNELFFTNNEPYFERNRASVSFSYKPAKPLTLQVGYLYQFDYKINDETGRDFLQIGLFIEMDK